MSKDLIEKAIDIKGKKYVLVSDRIVYFNETYKDGHIKTELLTPPDGDMVVVKATVTVYHTEREGGTTRVIEKNFTGHSQATWGDGYINKTSALENAETSAVGRALAFMGIGVIDSIASVDEIKKTEVTKPREPINPIQARKNAEKAINEASLEELTKVEKNIQNSKILTADDKEELAFMISEKRQNSDPTID